MFLIMMKKCVSLNLDRITTRSPGNGAAAIGRYNGRFGQSSDRGGGVTPVQRQGYPSVQSGVGHQAGTVRADFGHSGDIDINHCGEGQYSDPKLFHADHGVVDLSGDGRSGRWSSEVSDWQRPNYAKTG